jgi:hypothetical protein
VAAADPHCLPDRRELQPTMVLPPIAGASLPASRRRSRSALSALRPSQPPFPEALAEASLRCVPSRWRKPGAPQASFDEAAACVRRHAAHDCGCTTIALGWPEVRRRPRRGRWRIRSRRTVLGGASTGLAGKARATGLAAAIGIIAGWRHRGLGGRDGSCRQKTG